jgi:beta-xylosidase
VLAQKAELGLLDGSVPVPEALADARPDSSPESLRGTVDLDPAENRALARELAERAIVLLSNDGTLPLGPAAGRRIAVIGPNAEDPYAVLGCYSFPVHVGHRHPESDDGIALTTLVESLRAEFPGASVVVERGTSVDGGETDGFAAAIAAASAADVAILALGDRAGLFGRGTSGEGCDVADLSLPGAQQQLVDAVLATGTPTVLVMLAGRPYFLGGATRPSSQGGAAAIVEAFFAGEEGTPAVAGVLSGRVNPSGHLPVSVPSDPGAQPSTYLAAPLARRTGVSNLDPTPAYWFGHGLSYTSFEWYDPAVSAVSWSDEVTASITIRNTGDRAGAELVQLYLHDPVASVVRPVQRLIAYARVPLDAGEAAAVSFRVPADLASFTGRDLARIVEPGALVLSFGRSAGDLVASLDTTLTGPVRVVDHTRRLHADVTVAPA